MRGRLGRGEASSLVCWWSANGFQWEVCWVANWFQWEFWALCRMLASCVFFASNVGCSMTFVGPCGPKFFVFGLLVSDHVGRNSSCLACWWVVNWFQWQMCCLGVRRFSMTGVLPWRSEVSMSGRLCAEVSSSICFQPSVRELFVPILWLPRRCVFDGFLQEF